MSKPSDFLALLDSAADVPAGCPRIVDGGDGPRDCPFVDECRSHLRSSGDRGPDARGDRVRLAVLSADTCARDVRDRAQRLGVELSWKEVGAKLGTSPQAAHATYKRALAKLQRMLRRR